MENLASKTSLKDTYIREINSNLEGREVILGGWIENIREMGKITFIILRDGTGKIQVKLTNPIEKLEKESVVIIKGIVKKDSRAFGGFEIEGKELKILSKPRSLLPFYPFQKEEPSLLMALDNRIIYLRRDRARAIFNIRSTLEDAFREAAKNLNFQEINPACIVGSSTEGGAQMFRIDYFNKPAFLAQSPQFYKQFAVLGGMERVFMTTPVFRAEKHDGPYHINEIHQMDIEIAFATDEDAIALLKEIFLHMLKRVKEKNLNDLKILGKELEIPQIKIITYTEAIEKLKENGEKIKFGEDFDREQEKKLNQIFGTEAIIVKDYPLSIRAFYSMPKEDGKLSRSYDLIYRGLEIASGAQRIHDPEILEKQIKERGLDLESFIPYISAFKYGAPPHAGWSIGLDRITMAVCGLQNIREAVMFPRDHHRTYP